MLLKKSLIFKRFAEHNPQPRTELIYHNEFELLVAVVLSAQTTDKAVNKVCVELFKKAPNPLAMMHVGIEEITKIINSLGFFRTKAKNIYNLSVILQQQYQGKVPLSYEQLIVLPGVGRKTANVVLNTLLQRPVIAVDTHVLRVSNRLGLSNSKTPLGVEQDLTQTVPDKYKLYAHHWLVLHGRYICIARKPKCNLCFLADICPSSKRGIYGKQSEYESKN